MLLRIPKVALFIPLFLFAVHGQGITWLRNLDEAKKVAQETGKPVLYDFTATWCEPCLKMDREFWPRRDVTELAKQFVCVKVDFDREKGLASKYQIQGIPNVVFTDPWGMGLVGQLGFGTGSTEEIFAKIKALPKDFTPLKQAGSALEADNKNLDALGQFAKFYQDRKFYWLANEFYKRTLKFEKDPEQVETVSLHVAFNSLRMEEIGDAIKIFQNLQKTYPESKRNDVFLYGLVVASVSKKKLQNANKFLAELKQKYPSSSYVAAAERSIQQTSGQGK